MDWQLTCRICLETGDVVSLFDWDENNEQLSDKYTFCCGVELTKNDTLPTLICLNCVDKLTFAYKFKQQCLTSNETLKECLEEFRKSSAVASASTSSKVLDTETITIKQENGVLLQYELPVEHDPHGQWTRSTLKSPGANIMTKRKKKKGRLQKCNDSQVKFEISSFTRKKLKENKESESLSTQLSNGSLETLKEEPIEDDEPFGGDFPDDDPDFSPEQDTEGEHVQQVMYKKRGRPRKMRDPNVPVKQRKSKHAQDDDDGEDVLLRETILAFSEPIPDHILNPKPKKKYPSSYKKKSNSEKTHTCETCGSSFTSNASLQAHIRRHLGIKPFVCSVCGYACVRKLELRRHMFRHTGERPYKCRICDRRFADFGSRQKHESVCGFACVTREALKKHMLRHTGEKPYKCRICERRFADFGTRQKHERLHMGIRPYQCSLCGKSFTYSYVLSNHMLTHTGEKKFSCAPCGRKFTKSHHLKYHNKVHHKELYLQQQLECEERKAKQIKLSNMTGVLSGDTDGTLQFIHATSEEADQDGQMQVVVEQEVDTDEKETDRAVANMQGVVLDEDFCVVQK